MGLFRRTSAEEASGPQFDHVVVDDALLARVDRLLTDFERQAKTGGTRDAMDTAVTAIARAGARQDDPVWAHSETDYMVRLGRCITDDSAVEQPHVVRIWSWLATVAEGAAQHGDLRLAARCVGFMSWWLLVQTPQMSNAAEMAMRLPGDVPNVPCGRLLTVGLRVLPRLPADERVIDDPPSHQNTVTVRDALRVYPLMARNRVPYLAPDVAGLPAALERGFDPFAPANPSRPSAPSGPPGPPGPAAPAPRRPSEATAVGSLTMEEVVECLREFGDRRGREGDEFVESRFGEGAFLYSTGDARVGICVWGSGSVEWALSVFSAARVNMRANLELYQYVSRWRGTAGIGAPYVIQDGLKATIMCERLYQGSQFCNDGTARRVITSTIDLVGEAAQQIARELANSDDGLPFTASGEAGLTLLHGWWEMTDERITRALQRH